MNDTVSLLDLEWNKLTLDNNTDRVTNEYYNSIFKELRDIASEIENASKEAEKYAVN